LLPAALGALLAFGPARAAAQKDSADRPLWVRPAASFVLPGTGQLMAGQQRAAVYFAAELYLIARVLQVNQEAHREADHFRALAYDVARRAYMPTSRDTVFEYYETMERFTESGNYDSDAGSAFVPEPDATTYNGSVWLLARRTFWQDPDVPPDPTSPEYQRALQFYQSRAVGPGYLWSWRDASLEHDVYRQSIRRSDAAFRKVQGQVGLLLANHFLSAVDAMISSRLQAAAKRPATLRTTIGERGRARFVLSLWF
jgi:hypothetical protein